MTESLERAEYLLDLNRPVESESMLRHLLAESPGSTETLRLLSRALLRQDRWADALKAADDAVTGDPDEVEGHQLRAMSLSALARHTAASKASREAVRLAPASWQAHTILAATLAEAGGSARVREALKHVEEARRLAPDEPDVWIVRGLCLDQVGRATEAAGCFREALRLAPGHAVAMNNLAALDLNRGRVLAATDRLTAALASAPQEEILRQNLDVVLLRVIRWNYFLLLIGGIVLVGMAESESDRILRIGVGALVFACGIANLTRVARRLPRGSRRWMLKLGARVDGSGQYLLALSVLAGSFVLALAGLDPKPAAEFARAIDGFFVVGLIAGVFWSFAGRRDT